MLNPLGRHPRAKNLYYSPHIAPLIIALLVLTSCASRRTNLNIAIYDQFDMPVEGANISIKRWNNGVRIGMGPKFVIYDKKNKFYPLSLFTDSSFAVQLSAPGYSSVLVAFNDISPNDTVFIDAKVKKQEITEKYSTETAIIEGYVYDKKHYPSPSATVLLEGTTIGAATDINGHYIIKGIPPGKYTIGARMVTYNRTYLEDFMVQADSIYHIYFILSPNSHFILDP